MTRKAEENTAIVTTHADWATIRLRPELFGTFALALYHYGKHVRSDEELKQVVEVFDLMMCGMGRYQPEIAKIEATGIDILHYTDPDELDRMKQFAPTAQDETGRQLGPVGQGRGLRKKKKEATQ